MQIMLKVLIPYIKPYRKRLILAFLGMVVFTVLSLLPPLINGYLVDSVVASKAWDKLPLVVLAIVLVPIIAHLIQVQNVHMIMLASRRIISDVRMAMYRKLLNLSMKYHSNHNSGALTARLMDDVAMLHQVLTGETVRIVLDVVIVVFSIWIMCSIHVRLAMMVGLMVGLYVVGYKLFASRIRRATHLYRQILDEIAGRLQETIHGVRQVRIFNREDWENTLFLDRTEQSLSRALEGIMAQVNLSSICQAISGFGSTFVFGTAILMILDVDQEMTYGKLVAFNSYMWMLITPVVRLTGIAGQFAETAVSIKRIAEILDEDLDIKSPAHPVSVDGREGAVEFKDVYFSYSSDASLYKGLSLSIPARTNVALVGETGCGKTTMTSLLMRFWDVNNGAVMIDGIDVRDMKLRDLRLLFGTVLQSPVLFEGTLAENIAYGQPDASMEDIERVAKAAEVHSLALTLPDGFNTKIGATGVKLSVGERQRISIARAILRDPLILIMDEATSSLDSHSEALIQKALRRVLKNRTSFVVAHRLSTIVNADMIVVMDQGQIVETGTHTELLASDGHYSRLYEKLKSLEDD